MRNASVKEAVDQFRKDKNGQVVLVLQGGGALGEIKRLRNRHEITNLVHFHRTGSKFFSSDVHDEVATYGQPGSRSSKKRKNRCRSSRRLQRSNGGAYASAASQAISRDSNGNVGSSAGGERHNYRDRPRRIGLRSHDAWRP